MLAAYHVHTCFCDGKESPDSMADAAFAAGYRILGFSAHAPVPLMSQGNLAPESVTPYIHAVRAAADRYRDRMEILAGLEIEWVPDLGVPPAEGYDWASVDFRIGAVHFTKAPSGMLFTVDCPVAEFERGMLTGYTGDGIRLFQDYYRSVAELVHSGGFEILGHLDLVKMHNRGGRWFDESSPGYKAAWLEAVDSLTGTGIVAEVNTGGLARGKALEPYPSLAILRELRARKVPIVIGADAHQGRHLNPRWRMLGTELARAAGYRELAVLSRDGWSSGPLE